MKMSLYKKFINHIRASNEEYIEKAERAAQEERFRELEELETQKRKDAIQKSKKCCANCSRCIRGYNYSTGDGYYIPLEHKYASEYCLEHNMSLDDVDTSNKYCNSFYRDPWLD